jgi:hypothetical protein
MSTQQAPSRAVESAVTRMATTVGSTIRAARVSRRWTMRDLASRAAVSIGTVHAVESGRPMSLETYARLSIALGLRPELTAESARIRVAAAGSTRDVVHAAMGECEAAHLERLGLTVAVDEPYQHFQFAGRADVLAWNLDERRLLHIENKSRIDDIQELAGTYNAKRAYLASAVGERLGLGPHGWRMVTHALAVLWSSELLHVLRLRTATFRAICPHPSGAFAAWWAGDRPPDGVTSSLVILDPAPTIGRRGRWIGLDELATARPRYRGYADAAALLSRP